MNRRGAEVLATTFLVVGVVLLLSYSWFVFLSKSDDAELHISGAGIMEQVQIAKGDLDFYVREIVKNAAEGLDLEKEGVEGKFIENVGGELSTYSSGAGYIVPELKEIEWQLSEERVVIEDGKIGMRLKFKVERVSSIDEREDVIVEYVFEGIYFRDKVKRSAEGIEGGEQQENEGIDVEEKGGLREFGQFGVEEPGIEGESVDLSGGNFFLSDGESFEGELLLGGYDTRINFIGGEVYAESYGYWDVSVGDYDGEGRVDLDGRALQRIPLGERRLLEDLEGESYRDVEKLGGAGYDSVNVGRDKINYVGYGGAEEYDALLDKKGGYSCGPNALKYVFDNLGKDVSYGELQKERGNGGGFTRGFLSLFDNEARQITWPSEMKKAVDNYGFDRSEIKGDNKLDQADRILESRGDAQVVVRIQYDGLFYQHWTVYEGDDKFYDDIGSARNYKVEEAFVVSK